MIKTKGNIKRRVNNRITEPESGGIALFYIGMKQNNFLPVRIVTIAMLFCSEYKKN